MKSILRKITLGPIYFLKRIFNYRNASINRTAVVYLSAKFQNLQSRNSIKIGAFSHIRAMFMTFGHGGSIQVGQYCYIGHNTYIWSAKSIKIGNRVLISHGVNIHDSNSHSTNAQLRHMHFLDITTKGHPKADLDVKEKEIVIEDDVWIGFNATILKGVTIGEGAIVSACSVVTKDVLSYTVVAGNPAKIIKHLER